MREFEDFIAIADPVIKREAKRFGRRIQGYDPKDLEQEIRIKIWQRFKTIKKSDANPMSIATVVSRATCIDLYRQCPKQVGSISLKEEAYGINDVATIEVRHASDTPHDSVYIDEADMADAHFWERIEISDLLARLSERLSQVARSVLNIQLNPPANLLFRTKHGNIKGNKAQYNQSTGLLSNIMIREHLNINRYQYRIALQEIREKLNDLI